MADSETYTKVSNDVLEALAQAKLNGTQYAICLVVWRYTFGFHKCEAELSAGFIAKATGSDIRQVKREIQSLIDRNIIIKAEQPDRAISVLGFNKDVSAWQPATKKTPTKVVVDSPPVVDSPLPSGNFTTTPVVDSPPDVVVDSPPNKENKENYKENIKEIVFARWNQQMIIVHKKLTPDIGKAIDAAVKKYGLENVVLAIERYAKCYKDTDYFFSYKWTLTEFLKQKNALPCFLDGGSKWENYVSRSRDGPGRTNNQMEGDEIDWGWQKEKT